MFREGIANERKLRFRLILSVILTIVGSGLLIAGFIVPPTGIIDSSVLVAFGETITFVAALIGIDYTYRYQAMRDKAIRQLKDNYDNE